MTQLPAIVEGPHGPNKRGHVTFRPGPFDYGQLAADLADEARASAERIRTSQRDHIIETGQDLARMKEKIAHGHFTDWIDRELNMSPSTARNYMRAAKSFADKPATVAVLPPRTLYRLAGVDEQARGKIVDRIEAGDIIDRDEVDSLIQEAAQTKRLEAMCPDRKKREADARRRQTARRQADEKRWKQEVEQLRERADAAADEMLDVLLNHLGPEEIADLTALWRAAGTEAVERRLAARRGRP